MLIFGDSFTRVQTIAHECLHSVQSKKMLWFNFIFTNLYLLYFVVITLLAVFGKIMNGMLQLEILTIFGMVQYFIRSQLEIDAMTKARYIAQEYLLENEIINKEQCKKMVIQFDKLNDIGIKLVAYDTLIKNMLKIGIIALILMLV